MGRSWTGVRTIEESRKLDIGWLVKNETLIMGYDARAGYIYSDGFSIAIESYFDGEGNYLTMYYSLFNHHSNNWEEHKQTIYIATIKSNLGIGDIPYFVCPLTGKRAKTLIMAYGHTEFVHRKAYGTLIGTKPLYYRVQQSSQLDYHNVRYFSFKRKLDNLFDKLFVKKSLRTNYAGKLSKAMYELERLASKMHQHDKMRLQALSYRHTMLPSQNV